MRITGSCRLLDLSYTMHLFICLLFLPFSYIFAGFYGLWSEQLFFILKTCLGVLWLMDVKDRFESPGREEGAVFPTKWVKSMVVKCNSGFKVVTFNVA